MTTDAEELKFYREIFRRCAVTNREGAAGAFNGMVRVTVKGFLYPSEVDRFENLMSKARDDK